MKIYSTPDTLPVPKWSMDLSRDENFEREQNHRDSVRAWIKTHGWSGKHSGRTVTFGVADGQAEYMIMHAGHLDYGDGYQYMGIQHFPFAAIIKQADHHDRLEAYFKSKRPVEA
jgi:hypothetical protein